MKLPVNYDKTPWQKRRAIREEYTRIQKSRCYYCDMPLTGKPCKTVTAKRLDLTLFPEGFLSYPIHLHHDHNSGLTIGATHAYCNGILFQYYGE